MVTTARQSDLPLFRSPEVIDLLAPAKPTVVYDTYWRFAAERQRIFFDRWEGKPAPWTKDSILLNHKFTNAYRAADRVSQYLIRQVIYRDSPEPREVFFRTLLFKLFNRISTWELLLAEFQQIEYSTSFVRHYDRVLTAAMNRGQRVYSPAYIMPSGGRLNTTGRKHRMHLELLQRMMTDRLFDRLLECSSMQAAFSLLRGYPTIGDFLAYQYVTDLNYSELLNFDEMQFVVAGPGALSGIAKCFSDFGGLSEVDLIKRVAQIQDKEFARLGLKFRNLWGRPLQLIDCQNLFCEVDKYARVAHPEIGGGGRTRIKQKFQANLEPVDYWFPPKWKLNDRIQRPSAPFPSDLLF